MSGGRMCGCRTCGVRPESGVPMIMRIWRGRVLHYKEQAYLDYLKKTGLSAYRQIPGNRGVFATTHRVRGVTEYVLVTFWDSIEAIRAFAGDDYEKAVYYPEDDAYLLSREPKVEHCEVKFAAPAFE
jgi:heme-degrading monooxygenase HmoA